MIVGRAADQLIAVQAALQPIAAGAAEQPVAAAVAVELVLATAADQQVRMGATDQPVCAAVAVQFVRPGAALQQVVHGAADQGVRAGLAVKRIGAALANQAIVADPAVQPVGAAPALQQIVAAAAVEPIGDAVAGDDVIAVAEKAVLDRRAGGDGERAAGEGATGAGPEVEHHVAGQRGGVDRIVPGAIVELAARFTRRVRQGQIVVGVDVEVVGARRVAEQGQRPAGQLTDVGAGQVLDLEPPGAAAGLAPKIVGGEAEVDVVGAVGRTARPVGQHRLGACGRGQGDPEIADPAVAEADLDRDPVDLQAGGKAHRIDDAGGGIVGDRLGRGPARGAGRQVVEAALPGPAFGEADRRGGVDQSEAVIVAEMHAAAVPIGGAIETPAGPGGVVVLRRKRQDLLHVAIAEQRVGLEHQRGDAGDDRRGERGARDVGVAVARGGAHADPGGRDQQGGAGVGEARHLVVRAGGGDRDRVRRILEVVIVDVVAAGSGIAGGEDDDRAQAVPAVRRGASQDLSSVGKVAVLEIVGEAAGVAPAVVDDVALGHRPAEGVVHLLQAAVGAEADPEACDRGPVGDAEGAGGVVGGAEHAGDHGAVKVAVFGLRVIIPVTGVVVPGAVVVCPEVDMGMVDAVVDDADVDAGAAVVGPGAGQVDRADVVERAGGDLRQRRGAADLGAWQRRGGDTRAGRAGMQTTISQQHTPFGNPAI